MDGGLLVGISHLPVRWMQETKGGENVNKGFNSKLSQHSRKRTTVDD